jgi:hypothetical protein
MLDGTIQKWMHKRKAQKQPSKANSHAQAHWNKRQHFLSGMLTKHSQKIATSALPKQL